MEDTQFRRNRKPREATRDASPPRIENHEKRRETRRLPSRKRAEKENVLSITYSPFVFIGGGPADVQLTLSDSSSIPEGAFRYSGTAYGQIGKIVKSIRSENVLSVGNYGLANMTALETVDLPNCTALGSYAIQAESSSAGEDAPLKVIDLPKVQTVGTYAFRYRRSLETVTLGSVGNPVTSISTNAFNSCTQSPLSITVYTSGGAELSGSPWGATNASVTFKQA